MKHFRTTLVFSTVMLMVGCSSLDSSSSFDDVAKSVKERHNYVQVITKDITPDAKAITGADIVKSNLYYVGNFPKTAETKVSESYIDMNVTYFKNYDQFDSVTLGGKKYTLNNYRPLAETCTEHCTVTQWFQFPLNSVYLSQLGSDNVEFSLSSKTNKNQIQFWVPKAYFDAAEQEAQFVLNNKQPVIAAPQIVNEAPASKSEEMVQYWFNEGTAADQKQFADWAFSNRSEVKQAMKTDSKPLEMMAYWYEKADKTQKAAILSWLISQE